MNNRSAKILLAGSLICLAIGASPVAVCGQASRFRDDISFDNDIYPIIDNFCVTCHSGEDPAADLLLTSYAEVREMVEAGDLLERINDEEDPMPPSGLIPSHMRRLVKVWTETGFSKESRSKKESRSIDYGSFEPPMISPVDVSNNELAFQLLGKTQGHWVGSMWLMGQDWDWMAFDFRAIDKSHIHGMFEGGTVGNLFTSFFTAKYKGKQTIMARNGGILNGIYRTSYFVLDKAERRSSSAGVDETYYRLVDAHGGKQIMYMELGFAGDSLQFNAYTSRMGLNAPPKPHMRFSGKRMHRELSASAARQFGFPSKENDRDFSGGLPKPGWVSENVPHTSASYVWTDMDGSIEELGKLAKDPYPINEMPNVAKLTVRVQRNADISDAPLLIYLSSLPLTDGKGKFVAENGYMKADVGNSILLFPEITPNSDEFTFTYLHPGDYFLTVIADLNGDSMPTRGDVSSPSRKVKVPAGSSGTANIADIDFKN